MLIVVDPLPGVDEKGVLKENKTDWHQFQDYWNVGFVSNGKSVTYIDRVSYFLL